MPKSEETVREKGIFFSTKKIIIILGQGFLIKENFSSNDKVTAFFYNTNNLLYISNHALKYFSGILYNIFID